MSRNRALWRTAGALALGLLIALAVLTPSIFIHFLK